MGDHTMPLSGPTVLLFGSLALSFDDAAFAKVREDVTQRVELHWIFELIAELPGCWEKITATLPSLNTGPGFRELEALKRAFTSQEALDVTSPLPNTLLVPLVVISQLVEYHIFLEHESAATDENVDLFSTSKIYRETIGLCTGLLSAFAASGAGSAEEFRTYGSVAVRLGMLIGTVVDNQQTTSRAEVVSTAWNTVEGKEDMMQVLDRFPDVSNDAGIS